MRGDGASRTAMAPAIFRAAHQVLDASPKILDDPVAVGLVEGASVAAIRAAEADHQTPGRRLARALFVLRSRFAEDRLAEAVGPGVGPRVGQYVMLGAGLDTFAYRQPRWARHLAIIEVDHPTSQAFKQQQLRRRKIAVPGNLAFTPIDFERQDLASGLSGGPFAADRPTFLSWLGVSQYLTTSAIEATLGFVRSLPPGSRIVFTFVLPDACLHGVDLREAESTAADTEAIGEPWLSRFEPDRMRAWLGDLGFIDCFHLSPAEASARYFAGRADGLPVPVLEQLIYARV